MGAHKMFNRVDEQLEHGGQVELDAMSMVPGLGEGIDALSAEYHGQHMVQDLADGNWSDAAHQGAEATWDALSAVPMLHEAMKIPNYLRAGSDAIDLVTGGDVSIGAAARGAMDRGQGIERDLLTGERTNAPLVSPETMAMACGHYAE